MLDNMADTNYEEYQKFVSKHISEGLEEMKKEKTEKINQKKITPKEGILLKFSGNLKELQIKEKDDKNSFLSNLIINESKKEPSNLNFEKRAKFYLNLCFHEK